MLYNGSGLEKETKDFWYFYIYHRVVIWVSIGDILKLLAHISGKYLKSAKHVGYFGKGFYTTCQNLVLLSLHLLQGTFKVTAVLLRLRRKKIGYSKAWLHHKGHNKHHWEYWTDFSEDGTIIANKMPIKYVIEMVCDWIGAGKVYSNKKWTQAEPLNYYIKVRKGRHFHTDTEVLLMVMLGIINDSGLEAFHKYARQMLKSGY